MDFIDFHEGKHPLINAVIEFNMLALQNPWNRNEFQIRIQIGAAGIRTERNQWSERKSQTLIIKNLLIHWTFKISRNSIEYASETTSCGLLACKWSLKVDSRLNFIDFRWENHSLIECARWSRFPGVVGDAPAGWVSNFYSQTWECETLQTRSFRTAN